MNKVIGYLTNGIISKYIQWNKYRYKAKDKEHLKKLIRKEIKKYGNTCSLNHIDLSDITDLSYLFCDSPFNGDISKWDVSHVLNMEGMFRNNQFNGRILEWDVSNVINMGGMFFNSEFNGDISQWDVSQVKDMEDMFKNCSVLVPWWYVEDSEERKGIIAKRKESIGLKEKIESELDFHKNTIKIIQNKTMKL